MKYLLLIFIILFAFVPMVNAGDFIVVMSKDEEPLWRVEFDIPSGITEILITDLICDELIYQLFINDIEFPYEIFSADIQCYLVLNLVETEPVHIEICVIGYRRKGDANEDGIIDYEDLFLFVRAWKTIPGDEWYNILLDYDDNEFIYYQDLFEFVFDWEGEGTYSQKAMNRAVRMIKKQERKR